MFKHHAPNETSIAIFRKSLWDTLPHKNNSSLKFLQKWTRAIIRFILIIKSITHNLSLSLLFFWHERGHNKEANHVHTPLQD